MLDGFEGKLTNAKWAALGKCTADTALRGTDGLYAHAIGLRADQRKQLITLSFRGNSRTRIEAYLVFEATAIKRINEIFQQCLPSHKGCLDVGYRVDEQFPFPKEAGCKTWGRSTQLCVQSQRSTL